MSKQITTKNGTVITLLNPSEKGAKFASELRTGFAKTNDGRPKLDAKHTQTKLTDTQKSWRSGYLAAQKDSAKCYNATHKKGKSKGKTSSKKR